ncbi:MAG: alpha/beta fold hydrolase [Candidatus Auribacterota bacterium]
MSTISEYTLTVHSFDGYPLSCRVFQPEKGNGRTIFCLHGVQSHSGWYLESSRILARAGFRVLFPDRRGSGRNTAARGDLASWKHLILDIEHVLKEFSCPAHVSILAISWSGKLAPLLAAKQYPWLDKMVLVTPGIIPQVCPGVMSKLRTAIGMFSTPSKPALPVPIPGPDYFTGSPYYQSFIDNDADTLRTCTPRFFLQTRALDTLCKKALPVPDVPALMLLAVNDRIIDNNGTIRYFSRVFPHPGSVIKEYPLCEHTLEFDNRSFEFINDIISFLG